jgi:ACS family glucarate transporter-like MFS transporter
VSAALRQSGEGKSHVRVWVIAFLCALSFLTYYDRQCIVRAQENIQSSLAISDDQMGVIFGVFWLAYAMLEIPGGWMGDRFGARLTIARIVLAWSLFTALTGAATGFYSLFAYRFLFGVGEAGAFPNMARIQSRWLPAAERARAGGAIWLAARFGAAFAPIIFGTVTRGVAASQAGVAASGATSWFASLEPWRIAFFISGAIGIVWCVAFVPWFRDEPADKRSVSAEELQTIESGRGLEESHTWNRRIWVDLFSSRSLWAILIYYFCGNIGWSFFVSWMPRYLKDVQGVAFDRSEVATALPFICGGLACFIGGALSDAVVKRTGRRRLGRAIFPVTGCLGAASAMLAIPYASTPLQATILLCFANAAFDFGQAANFASIVDIGGRNAGIAMGFINIGCLGNAVQPYLGAMIFKNYGWNVLFVVYAIAFFMAMTMWAVIDPTRTFYDKRPKTD